MYYIERGLGKSFRPLAIVFAVCAIVSTLGSGNMAQANTVAVSAAADFGWPSWIVGVLLVLVVGAAIMGGIRSIAKLTSAMAPVMALFYVAAALVILAIHAPQVPGALWDIVRLAFQPEAGVGGAVGAISTTLLWGVKRGLFSNEAGQGSAPIAHAAAKTNEPVREGAVAMLGPLIDTLVICTMTALVIVVTGVWKDTKPASIPLLDAEIVLSSEAAASPETPSHSEEPEVRGRPCVGYSEGSSLWFFFPSGQRDGRNAESAIEQCRSKRCQKQCQ